MQISPTRVLFYTDIDDSLIGWAKYNEKADELGLERTRDTLERHPEVACVPSTSRGLSETQRLAPMLEGYPMQMVGVNNGQQLFVNDTGKPADEWLMSLTPAIETPAPEWRLAC